MPGWALHGKSRLEADAMRGCAGTYWCTPILPAGNGRLSMIFGINLTDSLDRSHY